MINFRHAPANETIPVPSTSSGRFPNFKELNKQSTDYESDGESEERREVQISRKSPINAPSIGKISSSQPDSNELVQRETAVVVQSQPPARADDSMNSPIQSRQDPPQTAEWGSERYSEAYYTQNPPPRLDTHVGFAQPNVVTSLIATPIEPQDPLDADVRNELPPTPPPPDFDWSLYQ